MRYSGVITTAVDRIAGVREVLGDNIDICIKVGRQLTPYEAVTTAKLIEPYNPLFFEDPIPPDSIDAMAYIATKTNTSIAIGERHQTLFEFQEMLERRATSTVISDVDLAGGLSHCRKIANLAEAFSAGVIHHKPLSPVTTVSTIQLSASIPNLILQEYKLENTPPRSDVVKQPITLDKGCLVVPDTPGIGIELNDKELDKYPYTRR